ncbi:patatin-like phospholipase family protein [Pengzhenrongella sicca]|uniref:Patatin-like phospholipase family protein n=1 Tax=Pengzhenrongella sicca TaxID=2819238 RepID=A0A8A4ZBE5_9MICO|nr:patatin-like phospholipase family protein [Pengzhenrongella sicca]QTE28203.1 patatin-like phospholipase family protein [Pengzhenrongella sicca]
MTATPSPTPHVTSTTSDATARARIPGGRALVFGGGGSTGNAWLIGVIAGLSEAGLDVTTADLTIGTSAGATTAAQLVGATPSELLTAILAEAPQQRSNPAGSARGRPPIRPTADHLERLRAIIAAADDPADLRRRVGAAALAMDPASADSWGTQWRSIVAARLPRRRWPRRAVLITAVDAQTGAPVVFDRHSGVDLADAVAASTAGGGFAYPIGVHRYIDGGYRSNAENADLAAGYERVLVLSPLGGRTLTPVAWGLDLATQVDELRAGGSRVETIVPDSTSEHLFGANAMDASLRPPAARAGYDHGRALAGQLAEFWH